MLDVGFDPGPLRSLGKKEGDEGLSKRNERVREQGELS